MTRTRIKICGLTRESDVDAAVAAGTDALGFVFYRRSKRAVDVATAARLMARVPPFVSKVALFVNADENDVRECLARLPIDVLQFHGDETPVDCARYGKPWIRAVRMAPGVDLLEFCAAYQNEPGFSGVLADAHVDGYGGGGKRFDWTLLPRQRPLPLILSGGLTPDNVAEAIRIVRPYAVDVSSGVEESGEAGKGRKSAERMERFIQEVRNADAGSLSLP